MRIEPRGVAAFLSRPITVRAVLFHGDDEAMVRARADQVTAAVIGATDDPFRVAWLFKDDHARLAEEASALSMVGGRRVIRVRDVSESLAPALLRAVAIPGDSLLVLEADALPKRSKLRAVCEDEPSIAAVACYPVQGAEATAMVRSLFAGRAVRITDEAIALFVARVGRETATIQGETDKLILFAGAGTTIDAALVLAATGDEAGASMDDALYAATAGQLGEADRALGSALEAGAAPVAICRMMLGHLNRLGAAVGAVRAGENPGAAVRGLRPPVLFSRVSAMTTAAGQWGPAEVAAALTATVAAELACKQSNARDMLIVRRLLFRVTQLATRGRRLGGTL